MYFAVKVHNHATFIPSLPIQHEVTTSIEWSISSPFKDENYRKELIVSTSYRIIDKEVINFLHLFGSRPSRWISQFEPSQLGGHSHRGVACKTCKTC